MSTMGIRSYNLGSLSGSSIGLGLVSGPEIIFTFIEQFSHFPAMALMGNTASYPALYRLGVNIGGSGDRIDIHMCGCHCMPQAFVCHSFLQSLFRKDVSSISQNVLKR